MTVRHIHIEIFHIFSVANGVTVCYWGSWSTYRTGVAKFEVDYIDTTLCTHYVYAYTGLINGVIASLDEYNDYEENYGKGSMKKFTSYIQLSEVHGLVGIGGWNEGSAKYSQMASTEAGRTTFADSVVAYCQKFGFEGLAFDWMYPTQRGGVAADKVSIK
ncbi:hypothetical protein C0J52_14231 [Blattella germanica]|nr:hypothetical protein C0J52_14231 [Blattella germanica]